MERRQFIKQAGLTAALVTTGGIPFRFGHRDSVRYPFTGMPKPEEWVEDQRLGMYPLLSEGLKLNYYSNYCSPNRGHGWQMVDNVPLKMTFVEKRQRPLPSPAFDEDVTYCFAEAESKLGPIRVDYLQSNIMGMIQMKLFLVELSEEPIGSAGVFSENSGNLYSHWYGGIRHKDYAFIIKDSEEFGPEAYQDVVLDITERKGEAKSRWYGRKTC